MSERITIDTSDLAYSLDNVTNRLGQTVEAVDEVGRCVCDAEKAAADKVCRSVNSGFFTLIRTQLMQKKVNVQAIAESQLLTLRHFAQSLRRIKHQLGVDFQRITARYTKLFKSLADALQNRIYSLDRPVAEVADSDYNTMSGRIMMLGAPTAVVQQDSTSVISQLAAVRCKRNCQNVLDGVKTLIDHGITLGRTMSGIMRDTQQSAMRSVFIPVVVFESVDMFIADSLQINFVMPDEPSAAEHAARIKKACFESMDRFSWVESGEEARREVVRRVNSLISSGAASEREAKIMSELMRKASWCELEAVE